MITKKQTLAGELLINFDSMIGYFHSSDAFLLRTYFTFLQTACFIIYCRLEALLNASPIDLPVKCLSVIKGFGKVQLSIHL